MSTSITIQEADLLLCLRNDNHANQRHLSELTGHSLGVVNKALHSLSEKGLVHKDSSLSSDAEKLIDDNSPRNAVILAAGFGMRMVPINWTTPKALLELNGERLIERIIRQLHEAGITDITVVVGFMKECFEYLIDKYDVKLAVNSDYAAKNNLSSLSLTGDILSGTYIIPSDIWCENNPFRQNELYSWYMVSDLKDRAEGVRVNRKQELVRVHRGDEGNAMLGIAYLTPQAGETVRKRLLQYSQDPAYDDCFWEEALYSGDRMIVSARMVPDSTVAEINTYEQLRELDSNSNHLRSEALDLIAEVLECDINDIVNIQVLKKGMTNRSFLFSVFNKKYIMRIPGEGTDQLINRAQEAAVYSTIAGYGLCDEPVYINPENGYKITRYIENIHCCDPANESDLKRCMKKLRYFHSLELDVPHTFDIFERIEFYESLWDGKPSIYPDYAQTKANVFSLKSFIERERGKMQLTHIDAVPDNFLFDPGSDGELSLQLTDWEYAGMQDRHVDIAMFAIYSQYDKASVDHLIELYFEEDGGCPDSVRVKIYCYIASCGLLWSNWCEYKRNLGVEFGEYSLRQYRFAKDYYRYAAALIKEWNL